MRTEEYVWHQNKDYVGGATYWSSNSLSNLCNCPHDLQSWIKMPFECRTIIGHLNGKQVKVRYSDEFGIRLWGIPLVTVFKHFVKSCWPLLFYFVSWRTMFDPSASRPSPSFRLTWPTWQWSWKPPEFPSSVTGTTSWTSSSLESEITLF